jgi:hypothetical protein
MNKEIIIFIFFKKVREYYNIHYSNIIMYIGKVLILLYYTFQIILFFVSFKHKKINIFHQLYYFKSILNIFIIFDVLNMKYVTIEVLINYYV